MIKFIVFLWLCLSAQLISAQSSSKIDQDPVFTAVLSKRLIYPPQAIREKVYTPSIIYTHFRIDSVGHIQDIITLNPTDVYYGFDQQIRYALHHLPPLNPSYQGEYILPIRFVFTHTRGETKVDSLASSILTDKFLRVTYPYQTLLMERQVKTYIPMPKGRS